MNKDIKPIAYLLVGLPGSGKSTWAEPYLARQFELVSSDAYIENMAKMAGKTYGDIFQHTITEATKWMNKCFESAAQNYRNLIWDQTNLTMKSRRPKLNKLLEAGYDVVAVTFEIPAYELEARRKKRAGETGKDIPPSVLESMGKTYQRPTRLEGFSRVIIVTTEGEKDGD